MSPNRNLMVAALLSLSLVAGAQERPSFEVQLPGRVFTPQARIAGDLAARVRRVVEAQRVDRVHVLVQFDAPVDAKAQERLAAQGLRLLVPVNRNTWYAVVGAGQTSALRAARWAELLTPADKLSRLLPATPYAYQQRPGGLVAYAVSFHKDVRADEVTALAKRLGARLEEFDTRAFGVLRTATFAIPPAALKSLAEADIVAVVEPVSPPMADENVATAQPLSNVDNLQAAPFGLSGTGITVGVWEASDVIDVSSLDIAGRVTVQPGQTAGLDDHANHVAGTIGASGVNVPLAEGMAPAVNILSWDSNNDTVEMTNAAALAVPPRVSNHSYGPTIGWTNGVFTNNQNQFGAYTVRSQAYDNVVTGTGLIVMKAAGNDRNNGPGAPGQPFDCTQGGLGVQADCIGPEGVAKNVLTIGAMNGAGAITVFTNFGPTDDGRIKPDLMAQGQNMLSLACNCFDDRDGDGFDDVPDSTTGTRVMSGTSMSTPVATGVGALVLEEAARRNITITPEGMKALLVQTARDVTGIGQSNPGPDYATGWGIIDAQNAVNLLRQGGLAQATLTGTGPANAWTATLYVPPGTPEVHVTLAWTDPSALPGSLVNLINDLDIRLIAPDATVFTPWILNPAVPAAAAVRNGGNDARNNVEQVSVLTPMSGVWTVQVSSNPGNLPQAPQNFAVAGVLQPSDIVLVMDRSGSMTINSGEPGISKIQALRSAANEFIDLLALTEGSTLGLVQFEENVVPFVPPFDLQPLAPANAVDAHTAVDSIVAGGMTNIISGVDAAIAQLSSAPTPAPRQAIVVFSDGQHNRPIGSDLNSIGPSVQGGNYRFFSIGFGTDVDDAILTNVANASGGMHVNEQDLSPIQLTKHFLTVGALVHDLTVLVDPMWEVPAGGSAQLATTATNLDRSLIFAINWTGQKSKKVAVALHGPGGLRCALPPTIRSGNYYHLIRVDLPYVCSGTTLHTGNWKVTATPTDRYTGTEKVDITILGRTRLRLDSRITLDKEKKYYVLTSLFTEDGNPLRDLEGMAMTAEWLSPLPRTYDGESQDKDGKGEPLRSSREKRIQYVRLQPTDDKSGFAATIDPSTLEPGIHQIRVIATMQSKEGEIRREATVSVHVGDK
ncbi:MAG TPA: S8 family serine peptidase [Thermoanaerobaculia bacterium]